ncbi:MAG: hypothetical protein KJS90_01300 [Acidobacteria bacterium]|nr:hypothetical protein [Acidobacteriota bacterium]
MPHPRTRGRRGAFLGLLVAAGVLLGSGTAHAHGNGTPTPADGEILRGTPERILLELPGDGPVTLELRDADGNPVAFTGAIERVPGVVRALPPVLEDGTYILEWRSENGNGWSTFSVGTPDATIAGIGKDPRPLTAFAIGTLLIVVALALARSTTRTAASSTNRPALSWTVASVLALGGAALLAPPSTLGGSITFLLTAAGAAGAALLAAGAGSRHAAVDIPDENDSHVPSNTARAMTVTGLTLLPAGAVAAIVRNTPANPFAGASLLALAALTMFLSVVLPLNVTRILAGKRGEKTSAVPLTVTLVAFVLLTSSALALEVRTRIDPLAAETRPAASCLAGTNRLQIQRCLDESLVATARSESIVVALDTLKRLLGTESRARFFCHEASHAIGRESLRVNGNLADAFRDGYDVCDFGYYHGIVEGAAGGFDDQTFLEAVPTLCEEFASAEELFYMQCNHGIGHAAARRTNNDMVRSLEFCDALALNTNLTGERLRIASNGCGTGVTMEWFATATADPNAAVTPRVSRPRDVCLNIPERWATECIEYVGNTLDASAPVESLRELGTWCGTTGHVEPCYRGLARAAAGVGIPARDAIAVCDAAGNDGARNECVRFYIAAVATTIDYDVSAVERICRELPAADREGPTSLCEQVRIAVIEVLAAGDGKR